MKESISFVSPFFNTHRMVQAYTERFYRPMVEQRRRMMANRMARARALAAWRRRAQEAWEHVAVTSVETDDLAERTVGETLRIQAWVQLAGLSADHVTVELYVGRVDANGELGDADSIPMRLVGPDDDGSYRFEAEAALCRESGLSGFTVRVLPAHPDLPSRFQPGLITWARAEAAR
jgi:starch phosphorylase